MADKYLAPQGGDISQLAQRIKKMGYNKDVTIEIGTVVTAPPSLSVRLDDGLLLSGRNRGFYVAGELLAHTRSATINGTASTIEFSTTLGAGDPVLIATDDERSFYAVIDKAVKV